MPRNKNKNKNAGSSFERDIVKAFNVYFSAYEKIGRAYRYYSVNYVLQFCDVLVDSPHFSFGIECKSRTESANGNPLYYSSFMERKQFDRLEAFCAITGRVPVYAIEVKHSGDHKSSAYAIPLQVLLLHMETSAFFEPGDFKEYMLARSILSKEDRLRYQILQQNIDLILQNSKKYTFDEAYDMFIKAFIE